MTPETPIRLEFENPPLAEQAISVVFAPIHGFRIVDYGLFWSEISREFPVVGTDGPIEALIEEFEGFRPREQTFQLLTTPPMPRAMFRNLQSGELIQLQPDRFGFNWAKVGNAPYPRSEPLMARFQNLYARFAHYVSVQGLGSIAISQCELTNLNIIPVSEFGNDFADLPAALNVDPLDLGLPYLKSETFERRRQHRIEAEDGRPVGRLHMLVAPVVSTIDNSKAFRYELTARSAPGIRTIEEACEFFKVARNAINGAFSASITDAMRHKWGEKHA